MTKYYREEGDVMVPVAEEKKIHHDIPGSIEVDTEMLPVISDIESLPVITEEEFERLKEEAGAYECPQAIVGDPSDPDYTETYLTVYESVITNTLNDRFFMEVK